jgi:hypothetical protein
MTGMARARLLVLMAASALLILFPMGIEAQDGSDGKAENPEAAILDDSTVILFPSIFSPNADGEAGGAVDEASAFGQALEGALGRALSSSGFLVSEAAGTLDGRAGTDEAASAVARAAGSRWVAYATFALADKRIAYSMRVVDATEAALAAASSFSAYAGLSSLPLMEDGARSVASKAAAYRSSSSLELGKPVQYRIAVNSPDEGATVFIGPAERAGSRPVGAIEGGTLLLPYLPFAIGSKIVLGLSAPGRKPAEIEVELGKEAPTIELPELRRIETRSLLLGTGPGRLLGMEATYRIFIKPEWSFLFINDRLFAGYDFAKGSTPVLHFEAWEGFGCYLVLPPESRFRFGACVGDGKLFSLVGPWSKGSKPTVFCDLALIPIELFMEYRGERGPTYWLSLRGAYSVDNSGLLGAGWIGKGGPDMSLGISWRR